MCSFCFCIKPVFLLSSTLISTGPLNVSLGTGQTIDSVDISVCVPGNFTQALERVHKMKTTAFRYTITWLNGFTILKCFIAMYPGLVFWYENRVVNVRIKRSRDTLKI